MWIVRLALRRPYTFVVASLLLLLLTPFVLMRTPTDIFPAINIPVVSVVWQYTGLSAKDIEQRMVYTDERALTTTVNNIEHIESTSYDGVGVVKVFFQPGISPDAGVAQVTAECQTILKQLPPGTTPPLVITYNASTVPILQYGISSKTLSEQQTFDLSLNTVRVGLISVPGVGIPYPFGGKQRVVSVDLDLKALERQNLAAQDVVNAISAQNLVYPSGTAKIGAHEYPIDLNTSPRLIERLNDLPIKTVEGAVIRRSDVAQVRDGYMPQQNLVRQDGLRSTLLSVLKNGAASTLSVANGVKAAMTNVKGMLSSDVQIKQFGDQSLFVTAAVSGVVREGVSAAALTAPMILLFLGSWRSTLIIAISIPLSVLTSLALLSAFGETINLMTLGGLALAVGILVDDATVTIENVERHLRAGESLENGIMIGAGEIALPALVSTMCICIVFVPMFFLTGVARYLFVPLAEAVVFAVLSSYLLSRTLVPTMAKYLLLGHEHEAGHLPPPSRNPFVQMQIRFEEGFERFRDGYHELLERCLHHRRAFLWAFFIACIGSFFLLVPWLGRDFFPKVDAGPFKLHIRARAGTRIEETASLADRIESFIRQQIPPDQIASIIDNIGLPYSSINLSYSNSAPTGPADADILVTLSPKHRPTDDYVHDLRLRLREAFSGVDFSFLPADIVSQILNFGLPSPIDIQVVGYNLEGTRRFADKLLQEIRMVPGTADLRIQQPFDQPYLHIDVDRTKAQLAGFTQRDVAQNLLISLSGSFQTSPSFWLDPKNGVSYSIATQTPQYRLDSLQGLENIPVTGPSGPRPEILASLASIHRGSGMSLVSHYDIHPVVDIYGSVARRDLGGVANDISKIVDNARKELPLGSEVNIRGQVQTMKSSYSGLLSGLAFAILLVYLLIVVNFQSWLDPFIIISALPAALAGIVWCLFVTHTRISVPSLTGSIMCMGVATANSILVVSFAKEQMSEGRDALSAALQAGFTRFRPVLMTALAMIIGMVPMAIGLGEGGEQNAPLGRAVIGGLVFATAATLFFVPVFFSVLHGRRKPEEIESQR